ncbi:MAG: hypothetical protein FJ035_01270 [Chloroflexi bacterium]|nr:hypothetical protein [Chloroflexota bacterium]
MKIIGLSATQRSQRATSGGPLVIATCNDWPDPSRSDAAYLHAPEARGVQAQHSFWDGESQPFLTARAVILRSTWNYHHDLPRFRRWLSLLEAAGVPVWNPPALVRWNLDKRYLLELGRLGIPVVLTVALDTTSAEGVAAVMRDRRWPEAVVKPAKGASGFAVRHVHFSEFTEDPPDLGMPDRPLLVQEYLPAVSEQGEVAFVFFAGMFSHLRRTRTRPHPRAAEAALCQRVSRELPIRRKRDRHGGFGRSPTGCSRRHRGTAFVAAVRAGRWSRD